jgi:tRNA threonylcarbamoyladenosine biosynthesis protein TsaE
VSGSAPPAFALEACCPTADDTRALGAALAAVCRAGDTLLLAGGLGAGKTTFTQGFASALGVDGPVTSPTFTLVRQYPCRGPGGIEQLVHVDVYRLDRLAEVVDLALDELLELAAVALVEWGEAVAPVLGDETLTVELERAAGDETRRVTVAGAGAGWAARRDDVAHALTPFTGGN